MAEGEVITGVSAGQKMLRLDLHTKILYGVGEFANSVKGVLFGLFILFFYTSVMGLPTTLVGLASGIGLIADAVIDPYIGHISDQTFWRFGRRHPFMIVGAVTLGLSFWALFSPPLGLSTTGIFGWFLITSLLVRLTNSIFVVPYHALGAEMCYDYHERTVLTGIRGVCGLLGAMGAASLSFILFFPSGVAGEDAKLNYARYPALGLTFGLAMSLAALIATLATLPWRAQMRHRTMRIATPVFVSIRSNLAVALRNPSFRRLFASFTLVFLGSAINTTLSLYFLTYYVKIIDGSVLGRLQLTFYGGAVLSIFFWLRIAHVIEKRSLYLIAILTTAFLMLSAFLFFGEGRPFGTGDARPLLVGNAIAGLTASVFWMLPASMLADVIDDDTLWTGERREGIFFGIFSFGQQLATGVSVIVAGVLVDWFAGLAPGQTQQSTLTAVRVAMLYSLLPAGLLLLGASLIVRYPLDRRHVAAIQAEIDRRHIV